MSTRLVNVRLDAERLRKAQALRERGVALSDVMREAIDERFAALRRSESTPDVNAIVARIFERYPDPPGLPARGYDIHDRRAARRAIARRLRAAPRWSSSTRLRSWGCATHATRSIARPSGT